MAGRLRSQLAEERDVSNQPSSSEADAMLMELKSIADASDASYAWRGHTDAPVSS